MEQNQTQVLYGKQALDALFENPEAFAEASQEQPQQLTIEQLLEEGEKVETPIVTTPTPSEPTTPITSNRYKEQAQFLIEKGYWKDVDIEIEVDGEKKSVPILELEMDADLFEQIDESQKAQQKDEIASKYIDVEGIDETTKKLIEIKKKGGDISELLQTEVEFINPIKNLDLEDEAVQEYLVRQKLLHQGLKEKYVDSEIQEMKENLTLDSNAKEIAEEINKNYQTVVDKKLQEREEALAKQQEEQKAFKKEMSLAFKDLNLKESAYKNIVENTAKFDQYGLTNVDKAFFELKKDPKKFAKIAFHILDEEAFNEFIGVSIKNNVVKDTTKKILTITPRAKSTEVNKEKKSTIDDVFEKL